MYEEVLVRYERFEKNVKMSIGKFKDLLRGRLQTVARKNIIETKLSIEDYSKIKLSISEL